MRLLVTGGAGYIGSIVVEQLLLAGHDVIIVDVLRSGNTGAVHPDAIWYMADLGDSAPMNAIMRHHPIDAVMHFAAETTVHLSMSDPQLYFHNNVANALVLLDAMRANECGRFIFSSTAALFGEPKYTPIDEQHPEGPINAYGESKWMFERVLDWYQRAYGMRYVALRYFNAAGASESFGEDHRPESHLIPLTVDAAVGRRSHIEIRGTDYPTPDGTCVRDYVHVMDLAQAHILALDRLDREPSGHYNLGNAAGFSVREVIDTVERVSGSPITKRDAERRPGDPAVLVASSALAAQELGWRPRFDSLEAIVESAWRWHVAHPNGYDDAQQRSPTPIPT